MSASMQGPRLNFHHHKTPAGTNEWQIRWDVANVARTQMACRALMQHQIATKKVVNLVEHKRFSMTTLVYRLEL